jgi:hypothetical protein
VLSSERIWPASYFAGPMVSANLLMYKSFEQGRMMRLKLYNWDILFRDIGLLIDLPVSM